MPVSTIDPGAADRSFALGEWTVEPLQNRISRGEISVRLEPRAMELLLCLVDHAGQVVPRQVLVDRVWAASFISDSTLTHTVADVRKALGDDTQSPRFIETIPKRGYRLVADVGSFGDGPSKPAATLGSERRPIAIIVGDRALLSAWAANTTGERFLVFGEQEIPLHASPVVFGRMKDAGIQLLGPEISRRHARLSFGSEGAEIEDLGSKNGTTVNDVPIRRSTELGSGDRIGIGSATLIYAHATDEPTRTRSEVTFPEQETL